MISDNVIISVDLEGLYKSKPISLLQVSHTVAHIRQICYSGISYIFDLYAFNLNQASSLIEVSAYMKTMLGLD
jgi:hypothetical protein